jgi:hypothetical protein
MTNLENSTARSFIANYIALSTLPTHAHLRWFIPGLIQPLHAIVILLMHLSTCSDLPSEELSSRRLIDDTLRLRVNHILKGNRMTRSGGIDHPQRANPRYLIMVNLRKSVWKKIGWEDDGKSEDPWAGKKREGPCGVASGEEGERGATDVSRRENGSTERDTALPDVESWNTWFAGNNDTGLENLDAMLTGDPLDMFQWDEWDSLTSDFFAGT